MFFFRNKHIMIDLGTGNNNKINWAIEDKQEFIDIVETVYRGARKGRGLVVSPKDYSTKYRYWYRKNPWAAMRSILALTTYKRDTTAENMRFGPHICLNFKSGLSTSIFFVSCQTDKKYLQTPFI